MSSSVNCVLFFPLLQALGREHHIKANVSTTRQLDILICLCFVLHILTRHSVVTWNHFPLRQGKKKTSLFGSPQPPAPEDLSIVCFTSGTTGTAPCPNANANAFVFDTLSDTPACCNRQVRHVGHLRHVGAIDSIDSQTETDKTVLIYVLVSKLKEIHNKNKFQKGTFAWSVE